MARGFIAAPVFAISGQLDIHQKRIATCPQVFRSARQYHSSPRSFLGRQPGPSFKASAFLYDIPRWISVCSAPSIEGEVALLDVGNHSNAISVSVTVSNDIDPNIAAETLLEIGATAVILHQQDDSDFVQKLSDESIRKVSWSSFPKDEPDPGDIPLELPRSWTDIQYWKAEDRLLCLFEEGTDVLSVVRTASDILGKSSCLQVIGQEPVSGNCDWEEVARSTFQPLEVTKTLRVCGPWDAGKGARKPGSIEVIVEPGMAYGSGMAPSTRLALRTIQKFAPGAGSFLDWGCGSGILSMCALLSGCTSAHGVDIHQEAIDGSIRNAALNRVVRSYKAFLVDDVPNDTTYDMVVCNIQAEVILSLLPALTSRCKKKGLIVLSGIIGPEVQKVLDAFRPYVRFLDVEVDGAWALLYGERRAEDIIRIEGNEIPWNNRWDSYHFEEDYNEGKL
mmetsp:Transcript_7253/g.11504  ORF Transcript_7253/g.11504 Transcript_7253/m.11504 type:complete len:449 (-) Transcript_7253:323-1669(-)|eukprot:CAMPEP_0184644722 /NCGR_PEP_ID=MMETSP0308-20130426/1390_1 /TAXON_ID=38269 /ORGANISM="Gloeochaete witrockiana, Strain SAG 46.84" /LENGTH=448 /DNA_ID=CAMNT_0027073407 /DNA_START=106 /DNA_END=1452 /DNA_ORIENTATION=+